MYKLQIIIRRLLKNKLNTGITIASLAIGIASLSFIFIFITKELSTDKFHDNYGQLYALQCDNPMTQGAKIYFCRDGAPEYMTENIDQIEQFCRIGSNEISKVNIENNSFFDNPILISASKNFFEFFSYKLISNNKHSVLEAANNVVISEDLAKKYFGSEPSIGKSLTLSSPEGDEVYIVSGIFAKPKGQSHLQFDMVKLLHGGDSWSYVKLKAGSNPDAIEKIFADNRNNIPVVHAGTPGQYYLKSLQDCYFDTNRGMPFDRSRNKNDLWISFAIGLIIFSIALFNFLGLMNNSLMERQLEFDIRRVNGSTRNQFILNILSENSIILTTAFFLGLIIMGLCVPMFNELTNANLQYKYLFQPQQIATTLLTTALVLGICFVFVSIYVNDPQKFSTNKYFKVRTLTYQKMQTFHIFQMACTIALVAASIVIVKQMKFIVEKPLGVNKDVWVVKMPYAQNGETKILKETLASYPFIEKMACTQSTPFTRYASVLLQYTENGIEKQYNPIIFTGDRDFISTLGLQLKAGEIFDETADTDGNNVIINQSLANLFPTTNLIGHELPGYSGTTIVGIVSDFHYSNLKNKIGPGYIACNEQGSNLMVKLRNGFENQALDLIRNTAQKLMPGSPIEIESIGDMYNQIHAENKQFIKLIGSFAMISIFLSMIGMFGISYKTSQLRTKEIGIRKVNGARVSEVLVLLNKDFVKWVAIAFIIATPIAYFTMNKWLENFAYKTNISWWIFVLAGLLALGIALFTVSWQSWKAARRNPVEALRYE